MPLVTTYGGTPVREPVSRSRFDEEAEAHRPGCNYCGSEVFDVDGEKGPVWCSDECREADGASAAADASDEEE